VKQITAWLFLILVPLVLLTLLLVFVPSLGTQQTVVVPDVVVEVGPTPVTVENTVEIDTDSLAVAIARLQASLDSAVALLDCDRCGETSRVVRLGQGALVVAAFLVAVLIILALRPRV
jgi:hypothetical protein|tara:strand:+ start:3171 stop:3524 length:354 start_codon:yes stop_codon:yes gene_type:complete